MAGKLWLMAFCRHEMFILTSRASELTRLRLDGFHKSEDFYERKKIPASHNTDVTVS
jgi:hypothetical protein